MVHVPGDLLERRLHDEPGRLAALQRLEVLDTASEPAFDNVVALVRTVLQVPMAAVTLIDRDRQWFKARCGLDEAQTTRDASFCTHTVAGTAPLIIPDALADSRFAASPLVVGEPFIRAYAGVPLRMSDGYQIGALCAIDRRARAFKRDEIAVLSSLAGMVVDQLELRQIAGRDALTGALSRRAFLDAAAREISRCRRQGGEAVLAVLDLDRFKQVNDRHGHPVGDRVLRHVTRVADALIRPGDAFGRLGGEEFALLLPGTGVEGGIAVAERLRAAIAAERVPLDRTEGLRVTGSIGVARLDPSHREPEDWIAAADVPLYRAKRLGRDRVMLADPARSVAA